MPTVTFTLSSTARKLEVRYKASPKHPNHALHSAATFGDTKLISTALANGHPVNAFYDGITPLHAAARAGKTTVVHMLIGAGAHVNVGQIPCRPHAGQECDGASASDVTMDFRSVWRDGYAGTEGCTPLHFAAANGHLGVLAFLLEQGADCRKPDKHGITPLVLAENLGQTNAATVLRDWDSKNPPIDKSISSSTSSIVATPNNLTVKRSLESFLHHRRKGSLLNRLFPRRSRSSASIPHLDIGSENQKSGNSSINLGTKAGPLGHNMLPNSDRPYQDDSRGSSLLSLGSSLGLIRTLEPRGSAATGDEGKDRARMSSGSPIREEREWGMGAIDGTRGVVLAHEGQATAEAGLETPGISTLAGEGPLKSHRKANESCLDTLHKISEDQPLEVLDAAREDSLDTGDDSGEKSAPWEQDAAIDSVSPPPANFRHPTISKFMSAHEIIQHLTEHRCRDLTDRLDDSSCGLQPVSWGGFGDVFFGSLLGGTKVAIKTARDLAPPSGDGRKSLKDVARELYIWSKCRHPNVLPLLGLVVFRGRLGMVSLWMENGNLLLYLAKHPDTDRCKMSAQICDGVSYLHRADVSIATSLVVNPEFQIHGDLKGANVVISSEGTPMLTDFGNAVLQEYTLNFTETTQRNTDVYALGMTILETLTGMVPFSDKNNIAVLTAVITHKIPTRPENNIPSNSRHGDILWSLLKRCWDPDPVERPSAAQVAGIMREINRQGLECISMEERNL
ncbi:hypothetical protein FRC10_007467 [Ceratobasidium sp. 414]|nr:hypothetical protein FRC10_007467 [Ceratobasidium sp. 414]